MNPECITRCGRHPSRFFTGFCAYCLAEKLSNVDSVERDSRERMENCDLGRKSCEIRARRTLSCLFQLDDINNEDASSSLRQTEQLHKGSLLDQSKSVSDGINVGRKIDQLDALVSDVSKIGIKFDPSHRNICNNCRNGVNLDSCRSFDSRNNDKSKEKGFLFRWSSVFSRKVLRWKMKNSHNRKPTEETNRTHVFEDDQGVSKINFRPSFDYKNTQNSKEAPWVDPRHSWDGCMIGKGITGSRGDENGENEMFVKAKKLEICTRSSFLSHQRRWSLSEDAMLINPGLSIKTKNISKITSAISVEEKARSKGSIRSPDYRETNLGKNSQRCKSWGWNLTSPFRDVHLKRPHHLDTSLSESLNKFRKDERMDVMASNDRMQFQRRSFSSLSTCGTMSNCDSARLRLDGSIRTKESMIGRSRSVHYYTHGGNLDTGLLRFYLTPLRSSRNSSKNRGRTQRHFIGHGSGFF